jgi:hypothetical protein
VQEGERVRANQEWLSIGLAFCVLFVAAAGCTRDEVKSNTTDKAESRAFDQPETTYLGRATGSISGGQVTTTTTRARG